MRAPWQCLCGLLWLVQTGGFHAGAPQASNKAGYRGIEALHAAEVQIMVTSKQTSLDRRCAVCKASDADYLKPFSHCHAKYPSKFVRLRMILREAIGSCLHHLPKEQRGLRNGGFMWNCDRGPDLVTVACTLPGLSSVSKGSHW